MMSFLDMALRSARPGNTTINDLTPLPLQPCAATVNHATKVQRGGPRLAGARFAEAVLHSTHELYAA